MTRNVEVRFGARFDRLESIRVTDRGRWSLVEGIDMAQLDETRLASVLQRELPGFERLKSVERLSGGASQETYRLTVERAGAECRLALRRAAGGQDSPRTPEHPGLDTEARLMRAAAAAGVPEPAIHCVLTPPDGLGPGFVMEWLDGETLGARIVRAPELEALRPHLAYACGQVLARIHAIDLDSTGLRPLLEPIPPETFVRQTWERYQALDTAQPMIDFTARWLLDHLPARHTMTLVHNDFRCGNFMVDPQHGIVAVLDWEMAHVGDPMRDLGWLCTSSWRFGRADLPVGGFGHYEDLFRGYESVSGQTVDREHVRFWEVFGSFWWAVGCLTMAQLYRRGPDPSVERPAIGRRSSECQVDCANLLIPGPVTLVPPDPQPALDMPRTDELIGSVRDFLREQVMPATRGRASFLARVGANSLDIVLRELERGPTARARELTGLRDLLGRDGDLPTLRTSLVQALRSGLALDTPGLARHLRETVVNRLAIDQPKYPALAIALGRSEGSEEPRSDVQGLT
jgi:aminoglycoside phosphotransferase (APT) family kinase protein